MKRKKKRRQERKTLATICDLKVYIALHSYCMRMKRTTKFMKITVSRHKEV